jgi:hypothetical protein
MLGPVSMARYLESNTSPHSIDKPYPPAPQCSIAIWSDYYFIDKGNALKYFVKIDYFLKLILRFFSFSFCNTSCAAYLILNPFFPIECFVTSIVTHLPKRFFHGETPQIVHALLLTGQHMFC